MTYKMLIVDDEPIICRGLTATIPWEKYDVEVVGVSYDGSDAIEKIEMNNGVDIVISDVKMPKKDGLQLARFLAENYEYTKMVLISGYDEFKYAQQAIQLGVKDYLLKPVGIDELIDVVGKLTAKMKQQQLEFEQLQQSNLMNAVYHHVYDYQREVSNDSDIKALQNVAIYPFLSMTKNYLDITRLMKLEEVQQLKSDWKCSINKGFLSNQLSIVSIFVSENQLLTCVVDNSNTLTIEDITNRVKNLNLNQYAFILYDEKIMFNQLDQVFNQFQESIKHIPFGKGGIFHTNELECSEVSEPYDIEKNLIKSIIQFNSKNVNEYVDQLFSYLHRNQLSISQSVSICKKIVEEIVSQLEVLLQKQAVDVDFTVNQPLDVLFVDSYKQFQQIVEQDIEKILTTFNIREADHKDWLIDRAITYMKTYYKNEIKAQEVADVINISPNYFSSLFKQKTGKKFNEYINHMRVEEAKKLLSETPYKVSEISEMVGFHEYKYFVEVFKKFTGVTPTKFRKFTV
ncbi:response regulator transcription factor [Aquibacillus sediminis]|uniref:response regulator transcription factor n=1 Tax=Aquibacillus sediminis TaxID=2574734 RepID=UPI00110891AC|nr:response regulator [Aquibacillus sediminis]